MNEIRPNHENESIRQFMENYPDTNWMDKEAIHTHCQWEWKGNTYLGITTKNDSIYILKTIDGNFTEEGERLAKFNLDDKMKKVYRTLK